MNWKFLGTLLCSIAVNSFSNAADKVKHLDELNLNMFKSGWGKTRANQSISGKALSIGGKAFKRGVGTHAESHAKIQLDGAAKKFHAFAGVDDASNGSIEFKVKLDGKLAWKSGKMKKGDAAKEISIKLDNKKLMELIVTDGGNGNGSDHANWCDASISYTGKAPYIPVFSKWQWITPEAELKRAKAALIPYPVDVKWQNGTLNLSKLSVSSTNKSKAQTAIAALKRLANSSKISLKNNGNGNITLSIGKIKESSSKEAYKLSVDKQGVKITANDSAGLFYGVQTLRQLMTVKNQKATIPFCQITDYPAFGIRGFMHDVGRNFISVEELKKQLDTMSLYKINVFQFHLTDNPAFRAESKKYPQLNDAKNQFRWAGKFYTAEQLKDLVAFCQQRHIDIIPELDMPGHSHYFRKTFGFDMQTDQGVKVLKDLVDEWVEIFPSPWFHLGTDEVKLTRKTFVAEMTKYVRAKGKKTISWHHGLHPYDGKTVHQCWNAKRDKNPIIDSVGYINTDDPIMQVRNYFFRQYCFVAKEVEQNLGSILCYWPDEPVVNEDVEMRIAPVYPAVMAFGERIWQGNPNSWPVQANEISFHGSPMLGEGRHRAFAEFEKRMAVHREKFFRPFRPEHFPFVKNSDVVWKTIGPFPNNGNVTTVFGPENSIKENYQVDGKTYEWSDNWGGTISFQDNYYVNKPKGKASHTAYALTYVHSKKAREVQAWINFSRKYLAWPQGHNPKQGNWACEGSRIWINDQPVKPPVWEKPGRYRAPVTEESYIFRKPQKIKLKKGWNKVLVKAPNLFKPWTISFLPIEWDGKGFKEVKDLKFSAKMP